MSHDAAKESLRLFIIERDGEKCINCGSTKDLHMDHCVPRVIGGSDDARNLQFLCRDCNFAKRTRIFNARFAELAKIEPLLNDLEHTASSFIPKKGLSREYFFHVMVKRKLQRLVGWSRSFPARRAWEERHPTKFRPSESGAILQIIDMEASGWFDESDPLPDPPQEFIFSPKAYDICYHHLLEIVGA